MRTLRAPKRRQAVRAMMFALACLVVVAGSTFRPAAQAGNTVVNVPAQAVAKRRVAKRSVLRADAQQPQAGKPGKAAKFAAASAQVSGTITPLSTNCNPKVPISPGETKQGALATSDCPFPSGDGTFYDEYTFSANAGQQVSISMTSTAFDTYLFLLRPSETTPGGSSFQNDDNCTASDPVCPTDSRIPPVNAAGGGTITLPETGTYSILANSFDAGATGAYAVTLNFGSAGGPICPPNPTPIVNGQNVNGTLDTNDCRLSSDNSSYEAYSFTASAGQQVAITMTSTSFDAFLELIAPDGTILNEEFIAADDNSAGGTNAHIPSNTANGFAVLPASGTYIILANTAQAGQSGNYSLTLNIAGSSCPSVPINVGQTINGALATTDCRLPADGSFLDQYTFTGTQGQQIAITMTATGSPTTINPFIFLLAPSGSELDDTLKTSGSNVITVRVPDTGGFLQLPTGGTYTIYANAFAPNQVGAYSISLTTPTACTYALTQTSANIPAAGGNFSVGFTTQAGCPVPTVTTTTPWLTPGTPTVAANGTGSVPYTAAANTGGSRTGTLTIAGQTFTVTQAPNCSYTLLQSSANVPAAGGNFSFGVTSQAGCPLSATEVASNVSWITIGATTINGTGNGTVNYTVAANVGPARTGTISVVNQTFTVTQAANCTYTFTQQTETIAASGGNFFVGVDSQGGCPLSASQVTSSDPSWLTVGTTTIDGNGNGTINYTVTANTGASRTATLTIAGQIFTVTQSAVGAPVVQFSAATYVTAENSVADDGFNAAKITVVRSSGNPATAFTVEYSTVDDASPIPCDPNARDQSGNPFPRGTAFARCDYATTLDTLSFAPNEMSKDFLVPLINDVHVEGNETVALRLSNPTGAALGTQSAATLTITDNDAGTPTTNPINQTTFFVRLQYLDFLSREPEPGEPWSAVLNRCADPFNTNPNSPSAGCDRIIVSQSFFGSPEFQLKGTFVFLFHKVAFGAANNPNYFPEYVDFATDLRRVTGATSQEVFAKQQAYTQEFVTRPAFVNRYSGMPNNPQGNALYVDTLLANVGATLTSPDPQSGVTRNSLVNDLNAGTKTRADVLRALVESQEVKQRQFNFAFVAAQYYGYLRRTPDQPGYQAWLNALLRGENSRTMVNGFMNSVEYRLRFGPNVLLQ